MLGVRGTCSLASCVTHSPLYGVGPCGSCAGPLRIQEQYILFAWRRGHQKRGATRALRVPRGCRAGAAVLIPFDAARVPDSVHQEAMWPNCVAGPRGSTRVLEEARQRSRV